MTGQDSSGPTLAEGLAPATVPESWRVAMADFQAPGEQPVAWLAVDLDDRLRFAQGLIVVTDRRIASRGAGAGAEGEWRTWDFRPGLVLLSSDHGGVGSLELRDGERRLACWRYTLAQDIAVHRLAEQFARRIESVGTGRPVERAIESLCPQCKAPLEPGQEECPICAREIHTPPSTWTLFRLWRFAKPYRWPLLTAFLLMLAATAATLVPPYLTMPLMDNILIPYQNGKPIDWGLASLYLGGLFGAAVLAWVLGWIKTYILLLVS